MRIITFKHLAEFIQVHPDAGKQLKLIRKELKDSKFKNVNEVKDHFPYISILKDSRVVFNVCGNKYRLILKLNFEMQIAYFRFIGTHEDYDKIDANTV